MMTGKEPADDETEQDSSTQATLDEFLEPGQDQQSSILDDEIFLVGVPESIEDGAGTVDNPFHGQSGAVRALENLQQPMAEIRREVLRDVQQAFDGHIEQTVRNLKEVSRSARLARRAVAPALVTSAVASSTVAGVDPAVIQTMGQLPMQEMTEAVRVMAELKTQSLSRMAAQEFQSLSTLAVTQLAEQAAQQLQEVTRIAEQASEFHDELAGMGAIGAVASHSNAGQKFGRPEPGHPFEQPEVSWVPEQSVSILEHPPTVADQELKPSWWLVDRVRDRSLDIILVVATETTGSTFRILAYQYPSHQPFVGIAGHALTMLLQILLLLMLSNE